MKTLPLRDDEQIVAEIRRFGLTYVWRWVGALIPFVVAGIYMFWLFRQGTIGTIGFVLLICMGIAGCVSNYVRFRGTVLILTNYRIIDIAKDGIMGRTISEAELGDIEDVVVKQRGLWRMMLNYGTIEIRVRDSKIRIDVEYVKRPQGVQRLINELKKQTNGVGSGPSTRYSVEDMHKGIIGLDTEDLLYLRKIIEARLKQLRG
ncbi:MAG TPA: PH domain-containing protein [Candidatus Magasanikbacteria bacterium]|nr:PH domain-containing protein [Candidatus Magasanikbacteria bacterium]